MKNRLSLVLIITVYVLILAGCSINNPFGLTDFDFSPPDAPVITGISEGRGYTDVTIDVIREKDIKYRLQVDGIPYPFGMPYTLTGQHTAVVVATKMANGLASTSSINYRIGFIPEILSITPTNGSESIVVDTSMLITCSQPLDSNTIGTVVLSGVTYQDDINCNIDVSNDIIIVSPFVSFDLRSEYQSISISGFKSDTFRTMNEYEDTDYSFRTITGEQRITYDSSSQSWARVEYNGSGYGLCWNDSRDNSEVYFARLDQYGTMIGEELRLTNDGSQTSCPDMVWNGSQYAVVFYDERAVDYRLWCVRVNASGVEIGADSQLTPGGPDFFPAIAWNGSEYGITYNHGIPGNSIYFIRSSTSAIPVGGGALVSSSEGYAFPDIVYNGSGYGVVWHDLRPAELDVKFVKIATTGVVISSVLDLGLAQNDGSRITNLIWAGANYGVVFYDDRDGNDEIYFSSISSVPAVIVNGARVTNSSGNSRYPDIAWNGTEYGIVWQDERDGTREIYFARMSSVGVKIGSDIRITSTNGNSSLPEIKYTGNGYAVTWHDDRDGNNEIYFTLLKSDGSYK